MNKMIRLSKCSLSSKEKRNVISALNSNYLGMGEYVKTFEKMLSMYFKRPTICVTNGTAALQLSIQALNIKKGDEIIVPSLTYISSFQSISANGVKPVACDVSLDNLSLDPKDVERKVTKKTKAIMPVHYSGDYGNTGLIYKIAKKYNLRIIEDAAHAFGSRYKNKKIGSFGDIVCFSFDGIKNITSGEGGCIVSNDKKVLNKIADLRLLGVSKDSSKRFKDQRSWEMDVKEQGWRYHMSNLMAAIGIEQLKRFPKLSSKRKKIAKYYDKLLKKEKEIQVFKRDYEQVVPHIYPIKIHNLKDNKKLRKILLKSNIQTGLHYFPNHLLSYYKKKNLVLKNTDKIYRKLITLPLHPDISSKQVKYIVKKLNKSIQEI